MSLYTHTLSIYCYIIRVNLQLEGLVFYTYEVVLVDTLNMRHTIPATVSPSSHNPSRHRHNMGPTSPRQKSHDPHNRLPEFTGSQKFDTTVQSNPQRTSVYHRSSSTSDNTTAKMENEKGEIVDLYVHLFPHFLDLVGFSAQHWDLGTKRG